MTPEGPAAAEVLEGLAREGLEEAEVFLKRGRCRRVEWTLGGVAASLAQEEGWAVRAGNRNASFFAAGTGRPDPRGPWPEPDGRPIRLPDPSPIPPWTPPSDLEARLVGEREGVGLLESLSRTLAEEVPGARLLRAVLEDGSSETELASLRGIHTRSRSRLALLQAEASGSDGEGPPVRLALAAREARSLPVAAFARRLADYLFIHRQGTTPERDRGEFLLAPAVGAALLAGLAPLLLGPRSPARMAQFRDRRGRVGSPSLTVIDNGRLPAGLLAAATDGEGLPTREIVLVEEGVFGQPLLAWWQTGGQRGVPSGCALRPSWRDLPRPGPTHLYIRPSPRMSVATLLASMARGYYLVEATGSGDFDLEAGQFSLPVCGFAVQGGKAIAAVRGAWLVGGIGALLHGVQAVARDLQFLPVGGMIGSPSLLVTGLELRRSP